MEVRKLRRVHRRFVAWLSWLSTQKVSQAAIGKRIGLTQGGVSMIARGEVMEPKTAVLMHIAEESATWPEGPIAIAEWLDKSDVAIECSDSDSSVEDGDERAVEVDGADRQSGVEHP